MIKRWRILIISLLLSFSVGQLVHADHSTDFSSSFAESEACYLCQSHGGGPLNGQVSPLFVPQFDTQPAPSTQYECRRVAQLEYQRLLRGPPRA